MRKRFLLAGTIVVSAFLGFSVSAEQNEEEGWIVEQTVDDFGDETGNSVVKVITDGLFSNTATVESPLTVIIFYDPIDEEFSFRLLEYNKTPATYLSNSSLLLKTKVYDTISEFDLYGSAPNGDLFISDSAFYSDLLSDIGEQAQSMDPLQGKALIESYKDYTVSFDDSGYQHLYNYLYVGDQDVRCIIEIDNSKYSFTIPSIGFREALDENDIGSNNTTTDSSEKAIEHIITNYKNLGDKASLPDYDNCFSILRGEYETYPIPSSDEIADFLGSSWRSYQETGDSYSSTLIKFDDTYMKKIATFSFLEERNGYTFKDKYTLVDNKFYFLQYGDNYFELRKIMDGYYIIHFTGDDSIELLVEYEDNDIKNKFWE